MEKLFDIAASVLLLALMGAGLYVVWCSFAPQTSIVNKLIMSAAMIVMVLAPLSIIWECED